MKNSIRTKKNPATRPATASVKCEIHGQETKDQFCTKCQIAVCSICNYDKHNGRPHYTSTIERANQSRERTKGKLEDYGQKVTQVQDSLVRLTEIVADFMEFDMIPVNVAYDNYYNSSIYDKNLKLKRKVFEEGIKAQRSKIDLFSKQSLEEIKEMFEAVNMALEELERQD